MITRGGYGLTRLLPLLDFRALAKAGKRWVGFSDFTAFHLAMLARAKAVTWAGPALLDDFAGESPDAVDEITLGTFREATSERVTNARPVGRSAPAAPSASPTPSTNAARNTTRERFMVRT